MVIGLGETTLAIVVAGVAMPGLLPMLAGLP